MERVSAVQLTLSSERSRHDCAVAKNSNADRISALCFTAFQAIACCCPFARGRHGKSKPRPVLAHRRSIAAWLCCRDGHSPIKNCKSALGFTERSGPVTFSLPMTLAGTSQNTAGAGAMYSTTSADAAYTAGGRRHAPGLYTFPYKR